MYTHLDECFTLILKLGHCDLYFPLHWLWLYLVFSSISLELQVLLNILRLWLGRDIYMFYKYYLVEIIHILKKHVKCTERLKYKNYYFIFKINYFMSLQSI